MTRHSLQLIALLSLSTSSACTGAHSNTDPATCASAACSDAGDVDGDQILDCSDTDIDGDGLRNNWDAQPRDAQTAEVLPGGLGTDGALVVDSDTVFSTLRTRLVGDAAAGDTALVVADASGFSIADEVLVLSAQGEAAGSRAFAYVAGVDGDTLTIEPPLPLDIAGSVVVVQRVPNYSSVEITASGALYAPTWDGEGGGVLALRAMGTVSIAGAVHADEAGYSGANEVSSFLARPTQGESWAGLGASADETFGAPNEGGGGAAVGYEDAVSPAASGGGGAYGADGDFGRYEDDIDASADGGYAYGSPDLSVWFFGSGGGAGAQDYMSVDGSRGDNIAGGGGAGGGIVLIFSETAIAASGTVTANGGDGEAATSSGAELGGGGGGAGGQIFLGAPDLSLDDAITAVGGQGGSAARSKATGKGAELVCDYEDTSVCETGRGGEGGVGRIRLDLSTSEGHGRVTPDPYLGTWQTPDRFHCDADGDGVLSAACMPSLTPGTDCDDLRPDVFPGATETDGDGVDQDCDGQDSCGSDDATPEIHGNDPW